MTCFKSFQQILLLTFCLLLRSATRCSRHQRMGCSCLGESDWFPSHTNCSVDILTLVLKDYIIQDCFILSGSDISDSTWTKWRWMDVDTRTFSLFSYIIHRTVFRSLLHTTQTQLPSFRDMFRAQEVFYFETLSRLECRGWGLQSSGLWFESLWMLKFNFPSYENWGRNLRHWLLELNYKQLK